MLSQCLGFFIFVNLYALILNVHKVTTLNTLSYSAVLRPVGNTGQDSNPECYCSLLWIILWMSVTWTSCQTLFIIPTSSFSTLFIPRSLEDYGLKVNPLIKANLRVYSWRKHVFSLWIFTSRFAYFIYVQYKKLCNVRINDLRARTRFQNPVVPDDPDVQPLESFSVVCESKQVKLV